MNYEEAIAYWFQRINFERRSAKPADLKLDRMRWLLRLLGDPHTAYPIVHIAGSKGKGSTAAMLASVTQHAGLRTGLFTSPHLIHVEERVQINDRPIEQRDLAALISQIRSAISGQSQYDDEAFTFFEIATAVGFLYFAESNVDLAVIEVGLGGRFDSTNVCDPLLAVITSISIDHVAQLGNTLAQIAREKAGIIKPNRPVISGVTHRPAREVIQEISAERHAELMQLGREFHYHYKPAQTTDQEMRLPSVSVLDSEGNTTDFSLGLIGEHQAANASLVAASVHWLREQGFAISDAALRGGLANVHWPARFEIIGRRPWMILDCAHNKASAKALLKTLRSSIDMFQTGEGKRGLIFAGSREKNLGGMLRFLAPHFSHVFLTGFANNPRCAPPDQLVEFVPASTPYSVHADSQAAWDAALAYADERDLICATGSVFLAGELRPLMAKASANRMGLGTRKQTGAAAIPSS